MRTVPLERRVVREREIKPIDKLITSSVRCTRCGAQGVGTCDCWVQCACGWTKGRGEECGNPNCSQHTKVGTASTAWDAKKHGTGPLFKAENILREALADQKVGAGTTANAELRGGPLADGPA